MVNLLPKIFPRNQAETEAEAERRLIRGEAEIGGKLFGPIPAGHHRQFFCLDEATWIWYEEWKADGRTHNVTTRYELHSNGVYKSQNGQSPQRLSKNEARNLYLAINTYVKRVDAAYEHLLTAA